MSSRGDHPGVHVPPPVIYLAFLAAAMLVDRVIPARFARSALVEKIGWVLLVAAGAIAIVSIGTFWRRRTTILPMRAASALVVEGPYRFSRNPMYVSMASLYLGLGCWFASWWPLLFFPAVIAVIDRLVIAREEAYLERRFGSDYTEYKRRVRRWL